jgi:hypothetical protein
MGVELRGDEAELRAMARRGGRAAPGPPRPGRTGPNGAAAREGEEGGEGKRREGAYRRGEAGVEQKAQAGGGPSGGRARGETSHAGRGKERVRGRGERERKEEVVLGGGGVDGRAPPGGGGGFNRSLRAWGGGRGGALGRGWAVRRLGLQAGPTAGRVGAGRRLEAGPKEREIIPPFYYFPNFLILIYFQMHAFTNSLNE